MTRAQARRPAPTQRELRREILGLAIPAFATLVAEPALLLADSAIIGHLGTTQLAGLAIAGSIITVIAGLCVFLAYGTTATVARRLGAGDRAAALAGGIDGIVLAVIIGTVVCLAIQLVHDPLLGLYHPPPGVADAAGIYLRIASIGLPALLIMLASTGVLRGLQDTRTPLKVAIGVNLTNIALNFLLVYGFDLGIGGAALGTVLSQYAAATFLAVVVIRGARAEGTPLRFHPGGIITAARAGIWLMFRSLWLQVSVTTTTVVATHQGAAALAGHQIGNSIWSFLAFALDAIAIAAQAIIGRYLGAGESTTVRRLTGTMIWWGIGCGIVFGLIILAIRQFLAPVFTSDPAVAGQLESMLLIVAALQPIAGVVFVLDGVLIGAGDARYLALAGLIALLAYLPLALLVDRNAAGLQWLWVAYGGYMLARMVTLAIRARSTSWMVLGADR